MEGAGSTGLQSGTKENRKKTSSSSCEGRSSSSEDRSSQRKYDSTEMESENSLQDEATLKPAPGPGLGGVREISTSLDTLSRSPQDQKSSAGKPDGSTDLRPETSLQKGATMQPAPSTGTKGLPTILGGIRRETCLPSLSSERKTSDVDHSIHKKPVGISVSMQTETSWIYERIRRKTNIHEVLSQDLSSLDVLCDMEFNEDFLRLFEESLRTLSHIGPPTILAYRPESSREDLELQIEEESTAACEYCGSLLRGFPSYEELDPASKDYETYFCCEQNRDLYEYVVTEKKNYENARKESISIDPHAAHGSEVDRQKAREKAYQRQQERQIAKQIAFMAAEQATFVDYSKQLKTISYQLSREPPSHGGWTLMPFGAAERVEEEEINHTITCCDFTIAGGKLVKRQFLEKYYKHGGKFLTIFPDGTAQLLININIQGGHYSDQVGNRVRVWTWPSSLINSTPRVSFKPIFISLNQHVGVRIVGQDKMAVSFLAMGQQAKFNVGTKVQVQQLDHLPPPKHVCEEELLLFACKIRIQRLFDRLRGCLNFSSTAHWDKIKPPSYLATQALKLMYLCKGSDISDDVQRSIRATINAPV